QVEHSRQFLRDLQRSFYACEAVGDGLIERQCAPDNTQQSVEPRRDGGAAGVVAQAHPRTVLSALDQEGSRLGLVPDAQSDLMWRAGRAPCDRVQRKQYPFRLELVVWPHREQEMATPANELVDRGLQCVANRRELVELRIVW